MSKGVILDCSATMSLAFDDENDDSFQSMLDQLTTGLIYVPDIWPVEVGNVLLLGQKRNRITATDTSRFLAKLENLSINVINLALLRNIPEVLSIGNSYSISFYDAQYLYLAIKMNLPLVTLDKALRKAAAKEKILVI